MAYALDYIVNRLGNFMQSWKTHAPEAEFGGMSLEEFANATNDSLRYRKEIAALETRLKGLKAKRDDADKASMGMMDLVVNSVRGTPGFGPNCGLYRALGYVTKSERKSGLVRKLKKPSRTAEERT
jgi:hypothetical protein